MTQTSIHPEGGWYCPTCNAQTTRLIITNNNKFKDLTCPACFTSITRPNRNGMGPDLHSNVGTGGVYVSVGKAWEIDNRGVSKQDGRTVINKITGRPAQR